MNEKIINEDKIAKIVIDCNFDLNSDEYECWELDNGVKVAFLPCVYQI